MKDNPQDVAAPSNADEVLMEVLMHRQIDILSKERKSRG